MKVTIRTLTTAALIVISPAVFAQGSSSKAPGQEMQDNGSVKGSPGASGYAPGQEMQNKGSKRGTTGASGYAPGRSTTGSGTLKNNDFDRDDRTKSKSK